MTWTSASCRLRLWTPLAGPARRGAFADASPIRASAVRRIEDAVFSYASLRDGVAELARDAWHARTFSDFAARARRRGRGRRRRRPRRERLGHRGRPGDRGGGRRPLHRPHGRPGARLGEPRLGRTAASTTRFLAASASRMPRVTARESLAGVCRVVTTSNASPGRRSGAVGLRSGSARTPRPV